MSKRYEIIKNIKVISINNNGFGVAKNKEGKVYFIKEGVTGDLLEIKVLKKKRNYYNAKIEKINKKSIFRTDPLCKHFYDCGGCKLQHIDYNYQIKFKQENIINNFKKIGKVSIDKFSKIIPAKKSFKYRNKMEYSFTNNRWLNNKEILSKKKLDKNGIGLHIEKMWDKILNIDKCLLQDEPSNKIRNGLKEFAIKNKISFYDLKHKKGHLRTMMIRTSSLKETMVLIQFYENDMLKIKKVLKFLKSNFPEINSLLYCVNKKANDSIYDQKIICFSGKPYIEEKIKRLKFKISAKSFFQTNIEQTENLYKIIETFCNLNGNEIVYDLYSGTGSIGLYLSKKCKKIIGIETTPEAVRSAIENSKVNRIENSEFIIGEIRNVLQKNFVKKKGEPDIVITDPPRNGMHPKVIDQLIKISPNKIVYVSCNSSTQARDLSLLKNHYKFINSRAIDMFPHTNHVENVVLLKRKKIND